MEGKLPLLKVRANHDAYDRLTSIAAPTLVCGGRSDEVASPDRVSKLARRIEEGNNQVELKFFKGGHLFLMQDVAALPAIAAFLRL